LTVIAVIVAAMNATATSKARLATLDQLIETEIPNFLSPVPSRRALRDLFDRENIPRFKANQGAARGGGMVFYSVSHVEKLFRRICVPTARIRGPVMG
jgi:hypothetical protein